MPTQESFAAVLSEAIASANLSLTDIVNQLEQQGLTLSTASLSYWKTGKSLPTRKNSLPVLNAIETMCSLPSGTLVRAVKNDVKTKRNRQIFVSETHPRLPDNTHAQVPKDSEDLESGINWEYEAEREIITDSYHISADFQSIQSEVMILARITNPSHSYLHISSYLSTDEGEFDTNDTGLRYMEGATIGDVIRHKNSKSITLRLDLPAERKVGDLHRVFYLPAPFHPTSPCKQSPNRHLAWPLRMYNCNVVFEGDVPDHIEWVTEATEQGRGGRVKQITTRNIQPDGNTVQITLENAQGVMGYFRWS